MINFEKKIGMRDDLFNAYAKELKEGVLTREEEYAYIKMYRDGDDSARNKIILANQGMVIMVAKSYGNENNLMDLISIGNLGLMEAFEKFDPDNTKGPDGKTAKFMSFAVWYVRRDIMKYILIDDQLVQKSNFIKTYSKVNKIKDEFFQKEHRYPTSDEIREALKKRYQIDIKDNKDLYEVSYNSINASSDDEDENLTFENSSVFNAKTASRNDYDVQMDKEQLHSDMMKLLSCLKERERTIMMMSTGMGYDREYTTEEIAETLNLTKERVRQLKVASAEKLKKLYPTVIGKAV